MSAYDDTTSGGLLDMLQRGASAATEDTPSTPSTHPDGAPLAPEVAKQPPTDADGNLKPGRMHPFRAGHTELALLDRISEHFRASTPRGDALRRINNLAQRFSALAHQLNATVPKGPDKRRSLAMLEAAYTAAYMALRGAGDDNDDNN